MSAQLVLTVIFIYFAFLSLISYYTARGANSSTFFSANRQASWYVVAFGMIGASLSGVTFVSLPGSVGTSAFSFFQFNLGLVFGYAVVASVLLPLYYRLDLVSIYSYLETRFGYWSYKTGAFFFLLSRTVGAAFRLLIVAIVLQFFLFEDLNVPFWVTVGITIALIWLYTLRGGIKTVLWTDTLQTFFILLATGMTLYYILKDLGWSFNEAMEAIQEHGEYSKPFFWDGQGKLYFFKQFFGGMFIAIAMNGLDQDMMQKNLTMRSIQDAQKNMYWFAGVYFFVNLMFLVLGATLYIYLLEKGFAFENYLPTVEALYNDSGEYVSDRLYPYIVREHLGVAAGVVFLVGIIAAAYSSADSALTALTTSFCVDFLDFEKTKTGEALKRKTRIRVHLMFSLILFGLILLGRKYGTQVISQIFTAAGYTYGPLLGLYAFGLLTKWRVRDSYVPLVCFLSPVICYVVNIESKYVSRQVSKLIFDVDITGYEFGFELLILNGLITFLGLLLLVKKPKPGTPRL